MMDESEIQFRRAVANKPYRPSNGTEGEMFMDRYCDNCIHEKWNHTQNDADKKCDILSAALIYSFKDKEYPPEWHYNEHGYPICDSYKHWDWDNGDGGLTDPPPIIDDPDQLVMPFILDEIEGQTKEKELVQ